MTEFEKSIQRHVETIETVRQKLGPKVEAAVQLIVQAYRQGNKLLVMGNGGSAADAQHLAAELVGRFLMERKALPAIALTTDTSILTAVGNDYGFNEIFSRQVEALAQPGDILVGISTSGHSENVKLALEAGLKLGAKSIGLLGRDGGTIGALVDLEITIPSMETPRIQEAHLTIIHILCDMIEQTLFSAGTRAEN